MKHAGWLTWLNCCLWLVVPSVPAAETKAPVGKQVENFKLQDFRGKTVELGDFKEQKLVVVAFLGTECPLAKLYGPRLQALADQYAAQGVAVVGLNANTHDSLSEMAQYAKQHAIKFPLLKDVGNHVADQMGAIRTPEVFLLDAQRKVRYWGRIDDQYGVGVVRDAPQHKDLEQAITELLAGKSVSRPVAEAVGCHIGRVQEPNPNGQVTYAAHIAPLLQKRCVECHRTGEIAPFALNDYEEVIGWGETIAEVVRDSRMPPWHADPQHGSFLNDRHLTDAEKKLIYQWVDDGMPSGDLKSLPKPVQYTSGWQLPRQPDLVLNITEKPNTIQADGEVRYQYFKVDPGFKEDKWIQAAELQPGNRAVVHHILAFARQPGLLGGGDGGTKGFLVGYVPGLRAQPFPPGMAKRIPAGSQLIFQIHYTPIGSKQLDQSKLGLIFADPKDIKYEVSTTSSVGRQLNIPPHADNYEMSSSSRISKDGTLLLGMMPHMHLRGKSFSYEAILPTGQKEMLLNIPHYDFNWQTGYRLSEPRPLASGTQIRCVAHYDNSEKNPHNPDPTKTVRWGDQTWEEMMIGYYDIAVPVSLYPSNKVAVGDNTAEDEARQKRVEEIFDRFDKNGDRKISKSEVPRVLQLLIPRLDLDSNDEVTFEELLKTVDRLPKRN